MSATFSVALQSTCQTLNMKIKTIFASTLIVSLAFIFNGCFKDTVVEKYTFYRPVYKTRAEVRAAIKSGPAELIHQPGKIFVRGNYIFLNDVNRGIHIIDYSTPASPRNIAFINIPGNVDIAVNGNFLYADQYTDLVTLDISNPLNISAVSFEDKVFPQQYSVPDTNLVIADWKRIDTTIKHKGDINWDQNLIRFSPFSSAQGGSAGSSGSAGQAGSMARFGLMNSRLYTVSTWELKVFNVNNAADPVFVKSLSAGAGNIETIYPFKNSLFVGSMNGMHIFSVANPDNPVKTGMFTHATACDPVIVDDNYAYVTLRTGTFCAGPNNQMDVVNIANLGSPSLVKTYPFTNPFGLAKDRDHIFLCDGTAGLRILNAQNVNNITTVKTLGGMETYDVIAINNIAITVAKDGLYLVDYNNLADVKVISKISTHN
jgi:hypothetical protein